MGENEEKEKRALKSGKDSLNLLFRNLGPGVRSAWVLKEIWEPEQ